MRLPSLACERSDDSPSVPSCPRPWPRWATWPATCAGPGTRRRRTSSRPSTPSCGSPPATTRSAARRGRPARLEELAADAGFLEPAGAGRAPTSRTTSPATAGTSSRRRGTDAAPRRSPTSPRSSASPPCCRSTPAASASSPATTSRPPATSACRSSASACSTGTATSSSRCPARAGSRRPTRSSTPTGCRSRCCARPDGSRRRDRHRVPGRRRRCWPGSGSPSVGRVPLLLLDSDVEENPRPYRDVTDRLYGGNTEHRLRQELLLGIGGVRALRAYSRITGAPGARGLPHQRGPRRLPRPRADPRAHRRGRRPEARLRHRARGLAAPAPSSPPTRRCPAGIDRFPRELVEQYFGGDGPTPGVPVERILALGAEDYDGGDAGGVQHGGDGLPARPARQRRLPAARPRQPRHVQRPLAGLRRGRGADHLDHQRRARPDLGGPRGLRPGRRRTAPTPTPTTPTQVWDVVDKVAGTDIWATKRQLRERLVEDARSRLARVVAASAAPPRPSSAGSTPRSTPTC